MRSLTEASDVSDLTVIIVSHQSAQDLGDCLTSVFARQGEVQMRVIVSDAGSTDGTDAVSGRFPVVFLPGPNDGFAKGNNRALAHPATGRSRYVLFLNPDTQLLTGTRSPSCSPSATPAPRARSSRCGRPTSTGSSLRTYGTSRLSVGTGRRRSPPGRCAGSPCGERGGRSTSTRGPSST